MQFTVFGVTTVQIYAGKLSGRCGSPDFSQAVQDPSTGVLTGVTYTVASADTGDVCSAPDTLSLVWANTSGVPIPISGINTNQGQGNVCPWSAGPPDPNAPGSWCAPWGNPSEGGQRNFDNILSAWLAIFQTVTLTGTKGDSLPGPGSPGSQCALCTCGHTDAVCVVMYVCCRLGVHHVRLSGGVVAVQ